VHVLIASNDNDLRLGLHVALANALPDAEYSIVRSDAEFVAVSESTSPGGIVVIDIRISGDVPSLIARSSLSDSEVIVLGDDSSLAAITWPPEIITISSRRGTRPVIDAVIAASQRSGYHG
jgi:hypothetical protein